MRILITGGNGMLGKVLVDKLKPLPDAKIYRPSSRECDLTRWHEADMLFYTVRPDIVFHLAANVGGIKYNLNNPASIYFDNTLINTYVIDACTTYNVKKIIFTSSACAYPLDTQIPTSEDELFRGRIESSNESYGTSKLSALVYLEACLSQNGLNFSYPILANLYGPGDRGFVEKDKAHLIPNLIRQIYDKPDKVEMFGNGHLTRDLLYVEDAADALIKCMEVDYSEPVNIATGKEVSIRQIVMEICKYLDYPWNNVVWPSENDKGELRRCYDTSKAKEILNWQSKIDIREGLKRTIDWYASYLDYQQW